MIITATHVSQDPVLGPQPPLTHRVEVTRWEYDLNEITDALVRLFRKFNLPSGGTLTIEGYGKTIQWEHDGFLIPLARQLLTR